MITQFPVGYFKKQGIGGNDEFTKLLLHMNGIGNSFVDSSASQHNITANGNVTQVSTPSSPLTDGGNVGTFDGSADFLSILDSVDWNFGTGNFTIDFWARPRVSTARQWAFTIGTRNLNLEFVFNMSSTAIQLFWNGSGSIDAKNVVITGSGLGTYTDDVWRHFAVVYDGTDMIIYVDGIAKGTQATSETFDFSGGTGVLVGVLTGNLVESLDGSLDEFRISNVARNPADWPPTQAYS
ncbi:MAG: LamG domain-containing protein [Candidatus Anammoxibacter sp.]